MFVSMASERVEDMYDVMTKFEWETEPSWFARFDSEEAAERECEHLDRNHFAGFASIRPVR